MSRAKRSVVGIPQTDQHDNKDTVAGTSYTIMNDGLCDSQICFIRRQTTAIVRRPPPTPRPLDRVRIIATHYEDVSRVISARDRPYKDTLNRTCRWTQYASFYETGNSR